MSKKFIDKVTFFRNVILRQNPFSYTTHKKNTKNQKPKIIGLIRERNEADILKDTLDHVAQFVDAIVLFDDASDDASVEIALSHPSVIEVIVNNKWKRNKRIWEETANRRLLHSRAKKYNPEWLFYFDADERFEGNIREYLETCPSSINAIRISLFDAYITEGDKKPLKKGTKLFNFRKFFGPEKRDILMIWRNTGAASYNRPDAREPAGFNKAETIVKFSCQHYGKALSIEHWEKTCQYYTNNFPKYSEKWRGRMGKAVHKVSDFGYKLYTWDNVKKHSVDLKEINQKDGKKAGGHK